MAPGPSRPPASGRSTTSNARLHDSPSYQYALFSLGVPYAPVAAYTRPASPLQTSDTSAHSQHSLQNTPSQRHNALRYRQSPHPAPGSHRESLLRQHTLVQEESTTAHDARDRVFSSRDADLAREDYVSHRMAEEPGFFHTNGAPGTGTRGLTLQQTHSAHGRPARSRATPVRAQTEAQRRPGFSGFARRQAQASPASDESSVRPRTSGYTRTSRFREDL